MNYIRIYPCFSSNHKCEFHLWAPVAKKIEYIDLSKGRTVPMIQEERGYWSLVLEDCSQGTLYKYRIDGDRSYPDPASLSQPKGVHGPSEVVDLKDFNWTDSNWKNIPPGEMIQYELHTGTFTSEESFEGIVKKLDYLKDLGINTIEIMPVSQFSGKRNWGYDGVYPFAVQDSYGGARGLMRLVNECHSKNIAVILDVVYNHFGPEGNYVSEFGPYFMGNFSTPWGKPLNFDGPHSDAVRNYFIQNALMWCLDFHVDGLRLDAVHAIFDGSAKHIMQELAENLSELSKQTGKKHYLIAESNLNDVRYISPIEKGGYGLDAQWSDDFHHALHALVTGERTGYYMDFGEPGQLAKAMNDSFVFDGTYSKFRKKSYGNSSKGIEPERFVIFNQNHDQVGNRKQGERLISLVGFEMAKTVAGAIFISPGIPMLFMGEEYGEENPFLYFVSHIDEKLNQNVREGREREFMEFFGDESPAPNPASAGTFKKSCLSWGFEINNDRLTMLNYYKRLIRFRKMNPVLRSGERDMRISVQGQILIAERWKLGDRVLAVLNFGSKEDTIQIPDGTGTMNRVIDSASTRWNGPGEISPIEIRSGKEIQSAGASFLMYSNKLQ